MIINPFFRVDYLSVCGQKGISPLSLQYLHTQTLFILYFSLRIAFRNTQIIYSIIILILSLLCSFESIVGMLQLTDVLPSNHMHYKITGSFFNPGPLGGYLAVAGILSLTFVIKYFNYAKYLLRRTIISHRKRLFLIIYFSCTISTFLSIIVIPITMSRSAIISLTIGLLVFIATHRYLRNTILLLLSKMKVLKISFVILLSILIIGTLYKVKQTSADNRLLIWSITLDATKENLLIGNGTGYFQASYGKAMEKYFQQYKSQDVIMRADNPDYAFNEYLQLANEIGILGLAIFLVIVVYTLIIQIRNRQLFGYALLALLVFAFFSYPLHILPLQILLVLLLSFRKGSVIIKINKWIIYVIFCGIFGYSFCHIPTYSVKIKSTQEWVEQRKKSKIAFSDLRNTNNMKKLYLFLNDNPRFLIDYANHLKTNKLYTESINILKESLGLTYDYHIFILLGDNYAKLKDFAMAELSYQKAHRILPNRLGPLYSMAILYYETNQIEKFYGIAKQVIDFNPKIESEITNYMKYDIINVLEILGAPSRNSDQ